MLRNVAVAAALAQTLAWTPAADSVRRTPLHAASDAGHSVVVNMLLQAGAKDFTEL